MRHFVAGGLIVLFCLAVEGILRDYSPINRVTARSAPALLIHGDADALVPLDQSSRMVDALEAAGVPARLVVKPGHGHGWGDMAQAFERFADWFDEHLAE